MDLAIAPDLLETIYQRYLAGEKAKALLNELGLSIAPGQFLQIFPPNEAEGNCGRCNGDLLARRLSRTDHLAQRSAIPYCSQCSHSEHPHCGCPECVQRRAEARKCAMAERRAVRATRMMLIVDRLSTWAPRSLRDCDECDLRCLLALASDMFADDPLGASPEHFVSLYRQTGECSGWRLPDITDSSIDAFNDAGEIIDGRDHWVQWRWNIEPGMTFEAMCQALRTLLTRNNAELRAIWIEIMADECFGFLIWCLKKVHLPTGRAAEPVRSLIQQLLIEMPASLVNKCIRFSVKDAANYSREQNCQSDYEAVGAISSYLDLHSRNQRDGKYPGHTYNRPPEYRRSTLNRVFFNHVLQATGDTGFERCQADYLPSTPFFRRDLTQAPSDLPVCCDCGTVQVTYRQSRSTIHLECHECGQVQIFEADPFTP